MGIVTDPQPKKIKVGAIYHRGGIRCLDIYLVDEGRCFRVSDRNADLASRAIKGLSDPETDAYRKWLSSQGIDLSPTNFKKPSMLLRALAISVAGFLLIGLTTSAILLARLDPITAGTSTSWPLWLGLGFLLAFCSISAHEVFHTICYRALTGIRPKIRFRLGRHGFGGATVHPGTFFIHSSAGRVLFLLSGTIAEVSFAWLALAFATELSDTPLGQILHSAGAMLVIIATTNLIPRPNSDGFQTLLLTLSAIPARPHQATVSRQAILYSRTFKFTFWPLSFINLVIILMILTQLTLGVFL